MNRIKQDIDRENLRLEICSMTSGVTVDISKASVEGQYFLPSARSPFPLQIPEVNYINLL